MQQRCVRAQHLTLVVPVDQQADYESPQVTRLKNEKSEMRKYIRELVDLADAEGRDIETASLYEIAAVSMPSTQTPQRRHFCRSCNKMTPSALTFGSFTILRPTAICECPPESLSLYCDAFERSDNSFTRCTQSATEAHTNGANLVCEHHRDVTNLVNHAEPIAANKR